MKNSNYIRKIAYVVMTLLLIILIAFIVSVANPSISPELVRSLRESNDYHSRHNKSIDGKFYTAYTYLKPTSGLDSRDITCYETSFGISKKIGSTSIQQFPADFDVNFDFKKCEYIELYPNAVVKSPDGKYRVDIVNSEVILFTPDKSYALTPEITDPNLSYDNFIWNTNENTLVIAHIRSYTYDLFTRTTFLTKISLLDGSIIKELPIRDAFYGASEDFAFPLLASPDKTKAIIQSNYISSFTVVDLADFDSKEYATKFAEVPTFSDEMYNLPHFNMFLRYAWLDDNRILYAFQTDGAKEYTLEIK